MVKLGWRDPVAQPLTLVELQKVRVPSKVVALFTRQLVALLQGSVPIVPAVATLSVQSDNPVFGEIVTSITRFVEGGNPLSSSLSQFPRVFPVIYVTMVQIGEKMGCLDASLERLADWLERDQELAQKIRSALTYPIFVLVLATVLTLAMFYTILPSFLSIFEDMHVELPLLTRVVVAITKAIQSPFFWAVAVVGGFIAFRYLRRLVSTPAGAVTIYAPALRVPVLGGMLFHGSCSRYCGSLAALLYAGTPLPVAFRLAAASSGSPLLGLDAEGLVQAIIHGVPPSRYMAQKRNVYSVTMVHFMVAGEESSKLPEMFARAGQYHGLQMEGYVEALGAALEPLLLVSVALVVGTVILSIFLPLYGMLSKL